MNEYEKNYLNIRPQRLCKMCGKCCRVVTTSKSYEELKRLCDEGDERAADFLRVFEPYPSLDAAKKEGADIVENILTYSGKNPDEITFYKCRYLGKNNGCTIYEKRPLLCKYLPSTPWALVPPQCGFEGWLFLQREERKQKIRKMKENILELQNRIKHSHDADEVRQLAQIEEKLQKTINLFEEYGSKDW